MHTYFPTLWVLVFLATAVWTTVFSLTSKPQVRGLRNLGLLAAYCAFVAMLIVEPIVATAATWATFGLAGGLLYYLHEWFLRSRAESADVERPNLVAVAHGLLAWPVMIPELIENVLGELGILKAPTEPSPPQP